MSSNREEEPQLVSETISNSISVKLSGPQQHYAAHGPETSAQQAPSPITITSPEPQPTATYSCSASIDSSAHLYSWEAEMVMLPTPPSSLHQDMSDRDHASTTSSPVRSLAAPVSNENASSTRDTSTTLPTTEPWVALLEPVHPLAKTHGEDSHGCGGLVDEVQHSSSDRQSNDVPMSLAQYEQELLDVSKAKSLDELYWAGQSQDDTAIFNEAILEATTEAFLKKENTAEGSHKFLEQSSSGSLTTRNPSRPDKQTSQKYRKTRAVLISDTHNLDFEIPKGHWDFIVCNGDHTTRSTRQEFERFIRRILQADADHIFLIFGNHEYSTDPNLPESKYPKFPAAELKDHEERLTMAYALQLCSEYGITFLQEGQHVLRLNNGTTVRIYASPCTPQRSKSAYNGYRYRRREGGEYGHKFEMGPDIDIAITHGPPEGVLDDFGAKTSLRGCGDLLEAVASSRPRLHCFGHNHAGWGLMLVHWEGRKGEEALLGHKLAQRTKLTKATKVELVKREHLASERKKDAESPNPTGCYHASHCAEDPLPIVKGASTLFANSAYQGPGSHSNGKMEVHMPIAVVIDLPLTTDSGAAAAGLALTRTIPISHEALIPGDKLVSGQPGTWVPPHKRQVSTDQETRAPRKTRASGATDARPVAPAQVLQHNKEDSPVQNVANKAENGPGMPPPASGLNLSEQNSTSPASGQAGEAESRRSNRSDGESAAPTPSRWRQDATRHRYNRVGDSCGTPKKGARRLSPRATPPRPVPAQLFTNPAASNPVTPNGSNSANGAVDPERPAGCQPIPEVTQPSSWRDRKPGANGEAKNGSGSGRSKKECKRGKYGSFNKNPRNRAFDEPWK